MISKAQKDFFLSEGYSVLENIINSQEINYYSKIYNSFLENTIDASKYRSDLSGYN